MLNNTNANTKGASQYTKRPRSGAIHANILGAPSRPTCRTKAADTQGVLNLLVALLRENGHRLGGVPQRLLEAGDCLVRMRRKFGVFVADLHARRHWSMLARVHAIWRDGERFPTRECPIGT